MRNSFVDNSIRVAIDPAVVADPAVGLGFALGWDFITFCFLGVSCLSSAIKCGVTLLATSDSLSGTPLL